MDKSKNKSTKPSNNEVDIDGDVSNGVVVSGSGNIINIGRHKELIVILIIVLIALGIFFIFRFFPSSTLNGTAGLETETPTLTLIPSPIPTNTVPPGEPTSTPIPPTDTPTLTPSPIPPVPLGEDWMRGCISTVWSAYPESIIPVERGDGCWREPVHAFSAENGDLDFLAERKGRGDVEIYGLFAPLPQSGTVTFTIRLRDLSNADLLMGIFPQPEVNSNGLLMILLNGNPQKTVFIQKDPLNYVTIQGTQALDQGNGYSISFRFDNLSVISIVNPAVFVTNPVSVPSSQKWLFLGYKGLRDAYRIEGTFLNFELKE